MATCTFRIDVTYLMGVIQAGTQFVLPVPAKSKARADDSCTFDLSRRGFQRFGITPFNKPD